MYTTRRVVKAGKHVIGLYRSGQAQAGDTLSALLARRAAGREKPIVMSDALAANQYDDDDMLIRCHCLAHGRRQFTDLEAIFPRETHQVITVLTPVIDHEAVTRAEALSAAERLAYPAHLPSDSQWSTPGGVARLAGTAVPAPLGGTQQPFRPGVH